MLLEGVLGIFTGLVGPIITAVQQYKMQKLKNENEAAQRQHELAMVDAETRAMVAETEANIRVAEAKIAGEIELADAEAYTISQEQAGRRLFGERYMDALLGEEGRWRYLTVPVGLVLCWMFGFVDVLKGLTRPVLTYYLVGCTTWVTWMAWQIVQKASLTTLTPVDAFEIFWKVVSIVVYLTVSSVTWWFADRRMAKFLSRLDDGNLKPGGVR